MQRQSAQRQQTSRSARVPQSALSALHTNRHGGGGLLSKRAAASSSTQPGAPASTGLSLQRAGTERRRSRTDRAWGCHAAPVLKTTARSGRLQVVLALVGACAPVRAPVRVPVRAPLNERSPTLSFRASPERLSERVARRGRWAPAR